MSSFKISIIRYIVYIKGQEYAASYNNALPGALTWAKITARAFHGVIIKETNDGKFIEVANYNRDRAK